MQTLIMHHDDCRRHDTGQRHPESSARIEAVMKALTDVRGIEKLPAPLATPEQVTRVHDSGFWRSMAEADLSDGPVFLDPDTIMGAGSLDAALRGSGAACFALDQIYAGKAKNAYCVIRPPGHHAESATAMGFGLINHVASAARHAQAVHQAERVAILDFDVHHGNGSQEVFENSPDILFISSHQIPLYPGTGYPDETGCGNILNLPLTAGSDGSEFRAVWTTLGLPALHSFEPDLILVSAGFDAHADDPLGQVQLQDEDFGWLTRDIAAYAGECCDGRLVSVLEGGYNLKALASSSRAHVAALTGERH
jgi:acetoin utilization deacetylase AcuC-like enzyme